MNRTTTITTAIVLTVLGLATGCVGDPGRGISARNNCDGAVQVALGAAESNLPDVQTKDISPGETVELGGFGDLSTLYARWGPTGVELDDSFPTVVFEPDDLIAAPDLGDDEFYFVIEGDGCP
jgi:hypothetical protein